LVVGIIYILVLGLFVLLLGCHNLNCFSATESGVLPQHVTGILVVLVSRVLPQHVTGILVVLVSRALPQHVTGILVVLVTGVLPQHVTGILQRRVRVTSERSPAALSHRRYVACHELKHRRNLLPRWLGYPAMKSLAIQTWRD